MQTRNQKRNDVVEKEMRRKTSIQTNTFNSGGAGGDAMSDMSGIGNGFLVMMLRSIESAFSQFSQKRVLWETAGFFFLTYLIVIVPLRISFFRSEDRSYLELDYFVDVYFAIDIVLRCWFFNNDVTKSRDSNGNMIEESYKKSQTMRKLPFK